EVHSDGLVTSDTNSRTPVGRLAERAPSLSDGSISMLPDGRMKVVFNLRKGVTWQDGTPFTAEDMVFSYQVGGPEGIPQFLNGAVPFMSSVEATDPSTLTIYYRSPYFQGALLGPSMFWPLPANRALRGATGPQLKKLWDESKDGTVYAVEGALRRYEPQMRAGVQEEPSIFDSRVRRALLQALDREAISDGVNGGNPQLA